MIQLQERPTAPLFELYSYNELEQRTGYSIPYLYEVAKGRTPITKRFRFLCCRLLDHAETELFEWPETAPVQSAGAP